ncbi:MAG TPA: transporter [Firmicutes bacterium]|jgi:queuosine precursor transporter|nr:transporter [Bacillota bacterium]
MTEKNMEQRQYRYFDLILGLFVAILLISNLVSVKAVIIPIPFTGLHFTFDGGTLLFPFSYIFSDILTEVYGYERSRRVIWSGFAALLLMALVIWLVGVIPADPLWKMQGAYQNLLMTAPRIAIASIIAYFAGEFSNSYILSRMKIRTHGKYLWTRTIGSTVVGELVDSALFVVIAFYGVWDQALLITVLISNYIFKTLYEIIATPLTYAIIGWLKKHEQEDHYDYNADYNPFTIK